MKLIKPLPGYVLIEPIEDGEKSSGGVYLPEMAKDKPSKGKLVNWSPKDHEDQKYYGEYFRPNTIMIYKKWVSNEVQLNGKTYLLVKYEDLLAVEVGDE